MKKKIVVLMAVFMAAAMILSEISYAQVGLAIMGARRIKKRMEKEQAKEEDSSAQKSESDVAVSNSDENSTASSCQKEQPAECR